MSGTPQIVGVFVHPSVREIAVLQEATQMILSSVDLETVLHQILLIVRNYFEVFNVSIYSFDPATNELFCRAQNGYETPPAQQRLAMGQGVIGFVAQAGIPLNVPDVQIEPRYLEGNRLVRSELALPLMVRESAIGVLDIESDKPNHFSEEMAGLLALFAGQAAIAIENARLYSSERKRMRQIELINLIARSATSANDIAAFLNATADLVCDTFEGCSVTVLLRTTNKLEPIASAGTAETAPKPAGESFQCGAVEQALESRTNVLLEDLADSNVSAATAQASGSELTVPLVAFGESLGAIVIFHPQPQYFSQDDRAVAQAAADVCATAVRNIQLGSELHRVTHTDFLTGLFNQRHFHNATAQEIIRCRRYHKTFSLVMFDIHNFRHINDVLGFNTGDELLRQAATTLRSHVRNNDVLCRYTADRFSVVLPETDIDHVDSIMAKIQEVLCRIEYSLEGEKRRLAAACGSVSYPQDGSNEVELIRKLQDRLQHAKSGGTASA
jgi:diguanylate cyclase (GGDEF)-like protein